MDKHKILLMIPGGFVDEYFTSADRGRLNGMGEVTTRNDTWDEDVYNDLIRKLRPRIVVTGWGTPRLRAETVRAVPELEYMCHVTGSIRPNIEKEAMEGRLLVTNWGRMGAWPVSEGALMMMLAALRRAWQHNRAMHLENLWNREIGGRGLFGQRVGLQGLGYIAQELVPLLKPFKCSISAYSPHCPDEVFARLGVRRVEDLKELYAGNDIISVHASKTQENFHIANADILASMPDGALLVNTARGAVIDEQALIKELQSGRISAALDVFENEPLPVDSPLRGLDNCLLFPHMAGVSPEASSGMVEHALENIERFVADEQVDPDSVVPPGKYDLMT